MGLGQGDEICVANEKYTVNRADQRHPAPRATDQWFEEEQPISVHPKDPYKRIDVLPSARKITVKVDGVLVAESSNNMFLFETLLRPRYYLPKSSVRKISVSDQYGSGADRAGFAGFQVQWQYLTESKTVTKCPYKGTAQCAYSQYLLGDWR